MGSVSRLVERKMDVCVIQPVDGLTAPAVGACRVVLLLYRWVVVMLCDGIQCSKLFPRWQAAH